MTIAIDCRMLKLSGVGRYLNELLPYICTSFSGVALLGITEDLTQYSVEYPNVKVVEMSAPIYSLKEQFLLYSKVPKCDIFWSPHFNIPMLPIKARYRVVTIHDAYHLAFYDQLSIFQKIYAKFFLNGALTKSHKVVTVSDFSKSEILKYTSEKFESKIRSIHNGVSGTLQKKQNNVVEQTVEIQKNFILLVGNVKPHKNLKRAILAFKKVINQNIASVPSNLMLTIVGKKDGFINGDSDIQTMFVNDAELSNRIIFTGHVSDLELENLYKNALCLIFPSIYEGFGFPPLEAMVFGCPTITSNAASMPEVCGDATLYFDPYDIDDMAQKITEILSSDQLRNEMVEKGYEQTKKFTWDISAKKHVELFKKFHMLL